jgi:dolichol-phosphate mannosyltransferase
MSEKNQQLTVVVPVYNEEACLPRFREETDRFLKDSPVKTTILFVDDGSTDGSAAMMKEICAAADTYAMISLKTNRGLSTAIKAGIDQCGTSLMGYIDADLQTRPEDFLHMLPYLEEFDMVNGIRHKRNDAFVKKMSSIIANGFRKWLLDDGIQDICCPLKIIKTEFARKIPFFNGMHRFIPALVQQLGGTVKQIPVSHYPRFAGDAKYHLRNRLVGPFVDALAVFWMKKRQLRYQLTADAS